MTWFKGAAFYCVAVVSRKRCIWAERGTAAVCPAYIRASTQPAFGHFETDVRMHVCFSIVRVCANCLQCGD